MVQTIPFWDSLWPIYALGFLHSISLWLCIFNTKLNWNQNVYPVGVSICRIFIHLENWTFWKRFCNVTCKHKHYTLHWYQKTTTHRTAVGYVIFNNRHRHIIVVALLFSLWMMVFVCKLLSHTHTDTFTDNRDTFHPSAVAIASAAATNADTPHRPHCFSLSRSAFKTSCKTWCCIFSLYV